MPPIIPPLILTLRWSERKKTETHLEKRKLRTYFVFYFRHKSEELWKISEWTFILEVFFNLILIIAKCITLERSRRQTLSSASVTWIPRILKSWTSWRLCTVPSLLMTCLMISFISIKRPVTIEHVKCLLHLLDLLLGELVRHAGHAVLLSSCYPFSLLLSSQTLAVMCSRLQGTSQYVITIIVTCNHFHGAR